MRDNNAETCSSNVKDRTHKLYRVSINSFPDYKHLKQENYVKYKYIFFTIT